MSKTYKVKCACKSEFQDKQYGVNVRIANQTSKQHLDGTVDVRCTVCNTVQKVNK